MIAPARTDPDLRLVPASAPARPMPLEEVPGLTLTDDMAGLSSITASDCAAAIWRRTPPQRFQSWLDQLLPSELPRTRTIIRPDKVRSSVRRICDESGTPDCVERELLIEDIAALAVTFTGITMAPWLRLRLDVVTGDACRKFHVDAITARLICTFRGPGTQFGLASPGQEPSLVASAPPGAAMILRGGLWPESPASGLSHRSPPIAGSGETRLVLVLDPRTGPEDQT